jgi:hypothetical protein
MNRKENTNGELTRQTIGKRNEEEEEQECGMNRKEN